MRRSSGVKSSAPAFLPGISSGFREGRTQTRPSSGTLQSCGVISSSAYNGRWGTECWRRFPKAW